MRLIAGLLIGLVTGTAIAKLTRPRSAAAPDGHARSPWQGAPAPLKETLDYVRQRAGEALDAAHEAAQQAEQQLRREYERAADRDT